MAICILDVNFCLVCSAHFWWCFLICHHCLLVLILFCSIFSLVVSLYTPSRADPIWLDAQDGHSGPDIASGAREAATELCKSLGSSSQQSHVQEWALSDFLFMPNRDWQHCLPGMVSRLHLTSWVDGITVIHHSALLLMFLQDRGKGQLHLYSAN